MREVMYLRHTGELSFREIGEILKKNAWYLCNNHWLRPEGWSIGDVWSSPISNGDKEAVKRMLLNILEQFMMWLFWALKTDIPLSNSFFTVFLIVNATAAVVAGLLFMVLFKLLVSVFPNSSKSVFGPRLGSAPDSRLKESGIREGG